MTQEYVEHVDPPQNEEGWIEYALQLLWSETDGYETTADNAAAELVDLRAELAALQEREKELLEKIAMARAQLQSTQYNWQEDCLFNCNDILTSALGEAQ